MEETGGSLPGLVGMRKPPPRTHCLGVWVAAGVKPGKGVPQLPRGHFWSSGPGPREASVLSHRRGNELQLEVLVLEDAVGSRATLGTTEWPVALAATALGEFCKERQLQRSGHTSTKAVGAENVCGGWMWVGRPEYVRGGAALWEEYTGLDPSSSSTNK